MMGYKAQILSDVRQYVCAEMAKNDAAHDADHVRRVVDLAKQLCAMEAGADPFRVELLAWLHDMNDDKLRSDVGADSLAEVLTRMGLVPEDLAFVSRGIPYISYRKYPQLDASVPLEIRIVQDADRIDAMGAVGIARTFAYGGAKNRSLEDSLLHFDEKLLHLYDLLSTESAQNLAKPRYEFLQAFYRQYKSETT